MTTLDLPSRGKLSRAERKNLPAIEQMLLREGLPCLNTERVEAEKEQKLENFKNPKPYMGTERVPSVWLIASGMCIVFLIFTIVDVATHISARASWVLGCIEVAGLSCVALGFLGKEVPALITPRKNPKAVWDRMLWNEYYHKFSPTIPEDIIALAHRTEKIPHSELIVHYLHKDPYLEIVIHEDHSKPPEKRFLAGWE